MKLNLGCFRKHLPGFVNVDVRADIDPPPDVVCDVLTLDKFEEGTADLIYASHVLEHFSHDDAFLALCNWRSILSVGGTLRLAVPDMMAAAEVLVSEKNLDAVRTMYWGSGKHAYDYHLTGWIYETLEKDLLQAGYTNVRRWEWGETWPHYYCDDYSSAYHPSKNLTFKNGKIVSTNGAKLMSLNVEATA